MLNMERLSVGVSPCFGRMHRILSRSCHQAGAKTTTNLAEMKQSLLQRKETIGSRKPQVKKSRQMNVLVDLQQNYAQSLYKSKVREFTQLLRKN